MWWLHVLFWLRAYVGMSSQRICTWVIYIGLYCAWVVYLNKHVVETKMRKCLTWIGCLMVFWFLIRTIKYLIIVDSFGSRVCWYLYYIPMILIPTLGLIAALLMDKGDEVKTEKQAVWFLQASWFWQYWRMIFTRRFFIFRKAFYCLMRYIIMGLCFSSFRHGWCSVWL